MKLSLILHITPTFIKTLIRTNECPIAYTLIIHVFFLTPQSFKKNKKNEK